MTKTSYKIFSTVSVIVLMLLLGAVIALNDTSYSNKASTTDSSQGSSQSTSGESPEVDDATAVGTEKVVTASELADANGQKGKPCYVVVDDVVYSISGFALWADGLHSPSGGRARCGKDLSSVIGQSPHGKSKLNLLQRVGVYQQ